MSKETIKVLLVDDDQGDFEMFRVMLSKAEHHEFKVDWVSNYEEALDAFDAGKHDVYFLDYFLEDRNGLDLLREARDRGIEAPIIMLTGRGSRAVDMEAMDLGASDYLVKGLVDPDSLERSVRHALERMEGAKAMAERDLGLGNGNETRGVPESGTDTPGAGDTMGSAFLDPRGGHGAEAPTDLYGDAARFWAVFESARGGIALASLQGDLMKVNHPFAECFSPNPRSTEGLSLLDLLDGSDREAVAKELEMLSLGEHSRFEAARRFLNRDGEMFWAHTTSVLIRNENGEPDHLMVLLDPVRGEG